MEERIRRTVVYLKILYICCWVLPLSVGVASELDTLWTGAYADNVRMVFSGETAVILLTVLCVPSSLKLFARVLAKRIDCAGIERALRLYKRWSTVRILLLLLPALAGFAGYYLLLSDKCLLCGLIALVALLFCVPGEKRLRNELHIDQESEE